MEIPEPLYKFRYHILATLLIGLGTFSLIRYAPSLLTILTFFWPLILSTALVLAVVIAFTFTSPSNPNDNDAAPIPKPAEELLQYVVADDHHHHHHHNDLPNPPSDDKTD